MKTVPPIRHLAPESVREAVRALLINGPRAAVVAGGLDLVVRMKERSARPEVVIDLTVLDELSGVRREAGGLAIGALTPLSALAREDIREIPWIADVAARVGGRAHRTAATLGGNLLSALRCFAMNQSEDWRTANGHCLLEGGDACHAAPGGECVSTHQTDLAPMLAVLEAEAEIAGPEGARKVPVRDLVLRPAEILTVVRVPYPAPDLRAGYEKLTLRRSIDRPILGIAAAGCPAGESVRDLRLAATGVGPEIGFLRIPAATPEEAAEIAAESFEPSPAIREDLWWRREVLPVLVRRAVHSVARSSRTGRPAGMLQ